MKLYDSIPDNIAAWAKCQPVFFTGSAATHGRRVNVSPKGLCESHFAIFNPNECAYIDRIGSGCETIAHSYDNGRLCLLFISFGPAPRILRLFCRSEVVEFDNPRFPALLQKVAGGKREEFDAARAVIICKVWQVQTSCGYGVPMIKKGIYADAENNGRTEAGHPMFDEELLREQFEPLHENGKLDERCVFEMRPTLDLSASKYVATNKGNIHRRDNAWSIDGLPGLRTSRRHFKEVLWFGDAKARVARIKSEKFSFVAGILFAMVVYAALVALRVLPGPVWGESVSKLDGVIPLRG
ncbi:hypothetical protein VHEMI07283 [[Torrubiella] hemipterigena]|uniref:Pyridoxamine phosphate oxidase family protein n=1 Tax=[Torrubiella] hemipterigena TaxID=1531966 RepID=A0A0A1T300_9HYPO|nr:hypothetical protein VHEMI07283 [[Torrubiella] hemipterigena]